MANIDFYRLRKEKKMAVTIDKIKKFLQSVPILILATEGTEGGPDIRTIGGFGLKDFTIYFATNKGTNKVKQLEHEDRVALFFQNDNQLISKFFNVTLYGKAQLIHEKEEFNDAKELILDRKPNLNISKDTHFIYKIKAHTIKTVDLSEKNPDERVSLIYL